MGVMNYIKRGLSKAKDPNNRLSLIIILGLLGYILVAFAYEIFLFPRPFSTILGLFVALVYLLQGAVVIIGTVGEVAYYRKMGHRSGSTLITAIISGIIVLVMTPVILNANLSFRLNFNRYQEFAAKIEAGEIGATVEIGDHFPKPGAIVPKEYTSLTSRSEVVVYNDNNLSIIIFPRDHGLFNTNAFIYHAAGTSPDSRVDEADPTNVIVGWYFCEPTFHWQWFECYRD